MSPIFQTFSCRRITEGRNQEADNKPLRTTDLLRHLRRTHVAADILIAESAVRTETGS